MKIYLDDERPCPPGWTLAKNYTEFTELVRKCIEDGTVITDVSFDHDLHYNHYSVKQEVWKENPSAVPDIPSGYDCCDWLITQILEKGLGHIRMTCHSFNEQGKINIYRLIRQRLYK